MSARDKLAQGGVNPGRLKLRARDAEDLRAIAVQLQDALVPLADTAFLQAEKRFVMVANRFRWERAPQPAPDPDSDLDADEDEEAGDARFEDANGDGSDVYERINCGLCFDRVRAVQARGIDLKDRQQILNLLTLTGGPGHVTMVFSGGGEIRLDVDRILCHLEDLGEPWPTRWRPAHDPDEPPGPSN